MNESQDVALLLVDHQSGLFQLVRDVDRPTLRHVTVPAKVSRLAKIPTFTTASVPDGLNGPIIREIHECNPEAVKFEYIAASYRALMESYDKAQDLEKDGHGIKPERLEAARRQKGAPTPRDARPTVSQPSGLARVGCARLAS